jgi:hypothetical protein
MIFLNLNLLMNMNMFGGGDNQNLKMQRRGGPKRNASPFGSGENNPFGGGNQN